MSDISKIRQFTSQQHIAVAGVSRNSGKFGSNAFRELKQKGYILYPVSPFLEEFEGIKCFKDIASLPEEVTALLISTKPDQTKILLADARAKGIRNIWMQQGSADKETITETANSDDNIITGECIPMFAEPAHFFHRADAFMKKVFGSYPV